MVTDLGRVLKYYRIMKNESLFTMSKELGMATSYLSGIENGRVEPTDKDLIKISAYLAGANFEVEYERIKENRARFEQFMELLQGENNSDESDPVTKVTNAVLNGGVDAEGIKNALHILPLLAKSEVTKDTETAKGKSTPIKSVFNVPRDIDETGKILSKTTGVIQAEDKANGPIPVTFEDNWGAGKLSIGTQEIRDLKLKLGSKEVFKITRGKTEVVMEGTLIEIEGVDYDHGHEYSWSNVDFVLTKFISGDFNLGFKVANKTLRKIINSSTKVYKA